MQLSDLIANLTKLKEINGDLPLGTFDFLQWGEPCEFGGFSVETSPSGKTTVQPSICWPNEIESE